METNAMEMNKRKKERWRELLGRLLIICIILSILPIQAFAASHTISNGWYMIESGNGSNMVLDINNWNMNNGCQLEIYTKNRGTNQIFKIEYVKTAWNFSWFRNVEYYTIRCLHSGKYVHTNDGRLQNTKVHQWEGKNTDNALWGLIKDGAYYRFVNKASGACLDNSGGYARNRNKIITYPKNKSYAQKWKLVSINKPDFKASITGNIYPKGKYSNADLTKAAGNISSNYPIAKIQIGVFNTSGNYILGDKQYPKKVNYSFDIFLNFKNIAPGQYYYRVRLWDVYNNELKSQKCYFNIVQADVYQNNGTPKYPSSRSKEVTPGIINKQSNRNALSYNKVIDQFNVTTTARYQRTSSKTFCNIFAWDVMSAMSVSLPHWVYNNKPATSNTKNANEMTANATFDWLSKYGALYGWTQVSAATAQNRANSGYPTIGIWKNPNANKSGHVMVVRPESGIYRYANKKSPVIAQAGAKNYRYTYVSEVMGSKVVTYYTHY